MYIYISIFQIITSARDHGKFMWYLFLCLLLLGPSFVEGCRCLFRWAFFLEVNLEQPSSKAPEQEAWSYTVCLYVAADTQ